VKRVVLDTNVTISAFFWGGHSRAIFELVRQRKVTLLSSTEIEAEFIRVMASSKFGLTPAEMLPFVQFLRQHAHFIQVKSKVVAVKDDPSDNIILECAQDGNADYIVSGDHHLLNLGNYQGIQIVRAKDFLIKEGFLKG